MMIKRYNMLILALCCGGGVFAQTLAQAKKWFAEGEFGKAKPVFERLVRQAPSNASYNFWYGACCYETGELQKSVPYLEKSAERKYIDGYLYLSKACYDLYRFDEAIENLEEHIYWLERKKRDTSFTDELMEKYRMGARMIRGVENVTVIDSFVVDKNELLKAYKLSEAAGTVGALDDMQGTYYADEWGDKMILPQTDAAGKTHLYTRTKLGESWSSPQPLDGVNEAECSQNYPFLNSDGITLYFASEGKESMGGYDIFITRYDTEDGTYLKPDNVGFPFNSPFNDYLYVIDDFNQLGWFASDRYQPEGKACVYVFVPNTSKIVYDYEATDPDKLRDLARMSSIRSTWGNAEQLRNGKQRLAQATYGNEQKQHEGDFEFVVNDNSVYRKLGNFRSAQALKLFTQLQQKQKDLAALKKSLEDARYSYTQAVNPADRQRMAPGILDKEKRVNELQKEISSLTVEVRNTEIKAIKHL